MTVFIILFQPNVVPKAHRNKLNVAYIDCIKPKQKLINNYEAKFIYAAGIVEGQIEYTKIRHLFDDSTRLWIDMQCLTKKKDHNCILFKKILKFKKPFYQPKTFNWPFLFDVGNDLQNTLEKLFANHIEPNQKIIMKALVIDRLWLSLMLNGQKYFECRTQNLCTKIPKLTKYEVMLKQIPLYLSFNSLKYKFFVKSVWKEITTVKQKRDTVIDLC